MSYRVNRNICASIVDFLTAQLVIDGWSGITVLKGTSRVYDTTPPIITVRMSDSNHLPVEIGDDSTRRETLVFVDIYGADSGIGLVEDLKDWVVEVIKNGINYYNYTIVNGVVSSKILDGKISFLTTKDSPINFDTPKNELDIRDRYRWLISLTVATDKIET